MQLGKIKRFIKTHKCTIVRTAHVVQNLCAL